MTAEQTAAILSTDVLVGFNLAMAREDLKCAITTGQMAQHEAREVVDSYMTAFNEAFYGTKPLEPIVDLKRAAEIVHGQLGCLAAQGSITVDYIFDHINSKVDTYELQDATNNTVRELIDHYLPKCE